MIITLLSDVVPSALLVFLSPTTFVKTMITCKSLYSRKSIHELVAKLYISNVMNLPFKRADSLLQKHRNESWLNLYMFLYNRQKRYSPILTGVKATSGSEHSVILSDSGDLYSWGYGILGALGHGDTRTQHTPKKIKYFKSQRIIDVSCGEQHTLAVTADGKVHGWGWTSNGRLGLGSSLKAGLGFHRASPTSIRPTIQIRRVSCGGAHTLLLSHAGFVLGFGKNDNGQLGTGDKKARTGATSINFVPSKGGAETGDEKDQLVRIQQIEAGQAHSLFLSTNGYIYACGCSCGGRLGITSSSDITKPVPIEGVFGGRRDLQNNSNNQFEETYAIYISAGSAHNILIDNRYRVWSFGWGGQGCLGIDHAMSIDQMIVHPSPIESLIDIPIVNASAGVSHSLFVSKDGAVFSCGFGKNGKLGLGNHSNEMRPRIMSSILGKYRIVSASAGGVHSILISECSTVLACGWCIRGQTGTAKMIQTLLTDPELDTNATSELNQNENECVLLPTPINMLNSNIHVEVEKDFIDNNINKIHGIYRRKRNALETKAARRIQSSFRCLLARQRFKKQAQETWLKAYDYRSGHFYYHNRNSGQSQWVKPYQKVLGQFDDIPITEHSRQVCEKVLFIKTAPLTVVATTIQKYYRGWKSREKTRRAVNLQYETLYDSERNAYYYYSNITNIAQWKRPVFYNKKYQIKTE